VLPPRATTGATRATNVIDHVFLSKPLSYNALSPTLPSDPDKVFSWYIRRQTITVLYSGLDDVLKYAYREQDVRLPKNANILIDEEIVLAEALSSYLHNKPALGYVGPDINDVAMKKLINNKIIRVPQKNWLKGHSAMRNPSPELFENIYKKKIIQAKGIKFGKYTGIGKGGE
jgi:hypothetical protein